MAKLKIPKRKNGLTVFLFQACIVADNIFTHDAQLYLVSKILMLAFFCVEVYRILHKGKLQWNQILLIPILFTIYCAATALWAYNPDLALSQMVTQVQLFLLLLFTFLAMGDGITVLDYLKALYISGFAMAIFALIRYGGLTQYINELSQGERMGGEVANLNTFGMVFGNAALSTAYYFILKKKRIHIVSFVIFTFFAFSSASRKAMLMIVAGVIGISVLHFGIRRIYKTLFMMAAVLVAAFFVLQLPYFSQISRRITQMLTGEETATDLARQSLVEFGLELFRERPVFGHGLNNFRALYIGGTYSHCNYIELLSGGGIVALVMYYLMFLVPALELVFSRKKGEKLPDIHLMLLVWLMVELVFGLALVQMYLKRSWILAGVLMAEASKAPGKRLTGREENHEAV